MMLAFFAKWFLPKKKTIKQSIYYFSPFFPQNAGYNWRTKKWGDILKEKGFDVTFGTVISKDEFYLLYPNNVVRFQKIILKRRFKQILESRNHEIVVVRRELLIYNDYGNLFLEKLLLHFHPNAILDFDDDLAAAKDQPKEITSWYGRIMQEHGNKFNSSLQLYSNFIVASNYLKNLVEIHNKSNPNICVIPTCVDYNLHDPKKYDSTKKTITFGWIGSTGNYNLLDRIIPDLNRLSDEFDIELIVIGGLEYKTNTTFPLIFKTWSLSTEIENLKLFDIGLMPLDNSKQSLGKGGFKLIQYMGIGLVSVASPVTINTEIISDSTLGFLVHDEWYETLKKCIRQKEKFPEIGFQARKRILAEYSFLANEKKYLSYVNSINN